MSCWEWNQHLPGWWWHSAKGPITVAPRGGFWKLQWTLRLWVFVSRPWWDQQTRSTKIHGWKEKAKVNILNFYIWIRISFISLKKMFLFKCCLSHNRHMGIKSKLAWWGFWYLSTSCRIQIVSFRKMLMNVCGVKSRKYHEVWQSQTTFLLDRDFRNTIREWS